MTTTLRPCILILVFSTIGCVAAFAAEQPYCAFEVTVSSASGSPRNKLPVVLIRNHQTTASETITDAKGVAKICDAPLEAVDIAVGVDVCGLVMVRDLHPKWPHTIKLYVTFDDHPCDHFVFPEVCQVLLRIQDPEGKALPGVHFVSSDPRSDGGTGVSDNFGRIYRVVKRNTRLEGKLEGYSASPTPVSMVVTDDKETKIVLRK